jgi:hypothetical protein
LSGRESRKIFRGGFSGHQDLLISDMRRRGPLGDEGQFQVVDSAVDHGIVSEEGDDAHLFAALRADLAREMETLKNQTIRPSSKLIVRWE